jgi:hypothetical protein
MVSSIFIEIFAMIEKVLPNRVQREIVQVLGQFGQPLQSFIRLLISTEMVLLG